MLFCVSSRPSQSHSKRRNREAHAPECHSTSCMQPWPTRMQTHATNDPWISKSAPAKSARTESAEA
jgi:hypothetical protein